MNPPISAINGSLKYIAEFETAVIKTEVAVEGRGKKLQKLKF